MRTFSKLAIVLGLTCFTASAQAQGPGGGRGGMMGGMSGAMLLSNKSVQKELKLSEEQVEKVTKASDEMRESMMSKFQDLRELEGEERATKMQALQKEMATEMKKTTSTLLSPEQTKRLDQISLQAQGLSAFADADVSKKLGITADQKSKLKDMTDELMSQTRELAQGMQDDREGTMKKMTALRKETFEKGLAVMTSEQKTMWKEMTGEPFELKMEGGMRGRRPNQ